MIYCCYLAVTEKETCKDDFKCPDGYLNLGDKECRGKCDQRECCEESGYLENAILRLPMWLVTAGVTLLKYGEGRLACRVRW